MYKMQIQTACGSHVYHFSDYWIYGFTAFYREWRHPTTLQQVGINNLNVLRNTLVPTYYIIEISRRN